MGLETATFIHQLDPANPVGGSDPKSQGDDHFRMMKSTLQNTFPNVEGAVNASHTELNILDGATLSTAELNLLDGVTASTAELNFVDGVTSGIQAQLDSKLPSAGAPLSSSGTPSIAAITNCSISNPLTHFWNRVGNIVTISGAVVINATNAGVSTTFSVTPPIASAFTSTAQAAGSGCARAATTSSPATVSSDNELDTLIIEYAAPAVGAQTVRYTAQYLVI
jgi:hypothetical protein